MPKRSTAHKIMSRASNKCYFRCGFCRKLLKQEDKLHFYVCEKVLQERFIGGTTNHGENHFNSPLGGSSVSTGTTSNSSLTNPLLGGRFVVPPPPEDK